MGRIFYLDAVKGNDENSGITPDKALKSLEAANQILFGAGDKLLLKCGCEWKGMLWYTGIARRFSPSTSKISQSEISIPAVIPSDFALMQIP